VMATHTRAELREAARVLARAARAAGVEPASSPPLAAVRRPALFDADAEELPQAA